MALESACTTKLCPTISLKVLGAYFCVKFRCRPWCEPRDLCPDRASDARSESTSLLLEKIPSSPEKLLEMPPMPLRSPSTSRGRESESELVDEVSLAVTGTCGCERDPFM
uniref:Uncharacterized protein n=1 Tax=Arundo donax TaxID=35708 RepID=A0A0A9EW11_ARUDO